MTRFAISLVATLAAAAGCGQAAKPQDETTYLAIMLNDQKAGYVAQERSVVDGRVTTTVTTMVSMIRAGAPIGVAEVQKCVETADGKPLAFECSMNLGLVEMHTSGAIGDDGKMKITQTCGDQEIQRTINYPAGALMLEGARLEGLRRGLKPGTRYEIVQFVPEFLATTAMTVTVGEPEKLDLLGRVVEGIKVATVTHMGGTDVPAVSYVDQQGAPLRMDMDLGGIRFTALQCDKAFALSPARSTADFFEEMLVTCPRAIPGDAAEVTFTIRPKAGKKVSLPETDAQKVRLGEDGSIIVTVSNLKAAPDLVLPYSGRDPAALAALKPTRYIQNDDPKIIEAAREAVGQEKDAAAAARRIVEWVHGHMKGRNLSIGYASASEVVRALEGDCTEYSVLAAAMCRAAGIPARVANGLLFVSKFGSRQNVLAGHAWTQAFLGGKWIDLDATRPTMGAAGRITMAIDNGELVEMFSMLNSLGLFDVTDVKVVEAEGK
jgi:hypothetical protein